MIDISIIVPVYFNEESISKTYDILIKEIFTKFPQLSFEIIYINDGSKDNSYAEIKKVKDKGGDKVKIINFSRNFGQVPAIYAGYEHAKGKAMLNIAADLQEPPELFIEIIESYLRTDAEIIAGNRIERDESNYRKITSSIFYNLLKKLSYKNMPKGGFDIILITQKVKDVILSLKDPNPFWQGQVLWTGFSVKFIPYSRKKRDSGISRWTLSKKIKYFLDGILNNSYAPLRFFSIVGIITFLLGIIYSLVIVIQYFNGGTPFDGWAPLMIVVLIFSGVQLIMLGLIGEYLWRTMELAKNKPLYVIEESIIDDKKEDLH